MAGPRPRQIVHAFDLVILIRNQQRDGAPQRNATPNAAEDIDGVVLEPLASTAAIAALPAAQLDVNGFGVQGHSGRKSIDQSD
jgi:hypothetical protein